ncbi:MAG: hypothetical protein QOK05_2524 [Chloroflexota bacterium]|jgi:PAS domain S-box-containing protein|nr:hypothetical protein [Chloroflexota bacterium]
MDPARSNPPTPGQWAGWLHALHDLAVAASGVLEPAVLSRLASEKANDLLGGDGAGLQMWDADAQHLPTVAQSGSQGVEIPALRPGEGAAGVAFETRKPLAITDYVAWNGGVQWVKDLGFRSLIAVPLLVQDRAIGCLTVSFRETRQFTVEEIELMTLLAAQVAPALEAARLHTRIQKANRQWRLILATSPQAIINMSLDGKVLAANRSALDVLGYSDEAELRRLTHRDLVRYDEGEPELQVRQLGSGSRPYYKAQRRAVKADGTEFVADLTTVLVRDENDRPAFFYIIFEDISERIAALEALRESRERLSVIVGNAPLILFAVDADGIVTLSEGLGLVSIGRTRGELVGKSVHDLYAGYPDMLTSIERALRGVSGERVIQLPDSNVVLDVRYSALRDDDGTPRGVIGVAIDISDRRRAEREREEAQERLRQSHLALRERGRERRRLMAALVTVQEEERRQIAAGIHDDTLQVLANLGFHLERLRRRSIARGADTDVLDHLDISLQMAVDRLRRLVFDLRPAALDGEGIMPALKELVQGIHDENGLVVDLTGAILSEPTGETRVALYRVAREALSNVRKHSSARRCELSLEEIDGWYHLVVRDEGLGFDPARAPEPGHIGLPSMKEHTVIMGGRMEVSSAAGEGTTVSIWLPGETGARGVTQRG